MKKEMKKIQLNAVASAREMIIWGLILVVVLIMGAKQFFTPLSKKVETAQSQLLAKQMELEAYKKFLKGGNTNNKKSLEGMDLNRQNMAQKVKDAFGRVNMSPDVVVSELLSALTNPAYSKAALLDKFNFISEKKQAGYTEMNLDLKLNGTYNGIAQYLGFLRQLPYLIRIDSIVIRNKEGENAGGKVELSAKAVLYVGEQKALENMTAVNSKSDMATDLLVEITGGKTAHTPFSAQSREMSNWSLHELKLTSTMAGGLRPTALINGKVFSLGDHIADFRIVEVRQREVVLEKGDVRHSLKIDESEASGMESRPFITRDSDAAPVQTESGPVFGEAPAQQAAPSADPDHPTAPSEGSSGSTPEQAEDNPAEVPGSGGGGGGGGSGGASSGSGSDGTSGNNPTPLTEEELAKARANPHGVLSGPNDSAEEVADQGDGGGSGGNNPPSGSNKLDPNSVEDIEGVPFEDLEEVNDPIIEF